MPSLKSHLIAFVLRTTRKKSFRTVEGLHARLAAARKVEDHRPPAGLRERLDIAEREIGGYPVYDVGPRNPLSARRIVYFHGGAYLFEMTPFHWNLVAEIAERLSLRVTVPIYPLAPEHDFHAMFGFALQAYESVLAEGPADDIVFMGDSAGGNMSVVLTMMAAEAGMPRPSRLVLISPGLDMTMQNPEVPAAARRDPWLDIPGGLEAVRLYSAGIDVADWRISPTHGDLSVLPPSLVFTGTRDLLCPDTRIFAAKARAAGADVELVVEKGMFHVWPLLDIREARRARDRIVAWLSEAATVPLDRYETASSMPTVTD